MKEKKYFYLLKYIILDGEHTYNEYFTIYTNKPISWSNTHKIYGTFKQLLQYNYSCKATETDDYNGTFEIDTDIRLFEFQNFFAISEKEATSLRSLGISYIDKLIKTEKGVIIV
jgi:hypothetical protein